MCYVTNEVLDPHIMIFGDGGGGVRASYIIWLIEMGDYSLSWKIYAVIFFSTIPFVVLMRFLGIRPEIVIITVYIVAFGGYILWWWVKNKRLANILEEKCDPMGFIKAWEKYRLLSKRKAFQNLCNLNIAVGYSAAGQYDNSRKMLETIDLDVKNSQMFKIAYHLACFALYINTLDIQKATFEYENYIKEFGNKVTTPIAKYAVEASILEYNYIVNKSKETAKFYLEQLDYLYNSYSTKLSKRIKLNTLYNKACLELELGNTDEAIKNFKIVIKNGNGLIIVEKSKLQLRMSENQLKE